MSVYFDINDDVYWWWDGSRDCDVKHLCPILKRKTVDTRDSGFNHRAYRTSNGHVDHEVYWHVYKVNV